MFQTYVFLMIKDKAIVIMKTILLEAMRTCIFIAFRKK